MDEERFNLKTSLSFSSAAFYSEDKLDFETELCFFLSQWFKYKNIYLSDGGNNCLTESNNNWIDKGGEA